MNNEELEEHSGLEANLDLFLFHEQFYKSKSKDIKSNEKDKKEYKIIKKSIKTLRI